MKLVDKKSFRKHTIPVNVDVKSKYVHVHQSLAASMTDSDEIVNRKVLAKSGDVRATSPTLTCKQLLCQSSCIESQVLSGNDHSLASSRNTIAAVDV